MLHGKKDIDLLTANQMRAFKHHSADVVTLRMLLRHQCYVLHNLSVKGSIPFHNSLVIAQLDRATETLQVRILLTCKRDSSTVEHYTEDVEIRSTPLLKW